MTHGPISVHGDDPRFDVLVVGAGHAGCEAAWAAARLGLRVGLCTLSRETVAQMPCNPAIGGTAKGHLVREIDALGGLMGRAIDATGIQFRVLNRSRGPAVWSPRAQADKRAYREWVRDALERRARHRVDRRYRRRRRSSADGSVAGLRLEDGREVGCRALVVTTGHVPERRDPRRPGAVAGRPDRGAVDRGNSRVAEGARFSLGPAEDRDAAAARPPVDRFRRRSRPPAVSSARRATTRSFRSRSRAGGSSAAGGLLPAAHHGEGARAGAAEPRRGRRSTTARSPGSGRATARRSRTRW